MTRFLDTSVVLRYLTGISLEQAVIAGTIIDQSDMLLITGVALAETAHVLASVYQVPRENIVDRLMEFVQKDNIDTYGLDKGYVLQGILMCRPPGRVSFSDALIWAAARTSGRDVVYSFDQRFPSDGIAVRAVL